MTTSLRDASRSSRYSEHEDLEAQRDTLLLTSRGNVRDRNNNYGHAQNDIENIPEGSGSNGDNGNKNAAPGVDNGRIIWSYLMRARLVCRCLRSTLIRFSRVMSLNEMTSTTLMAFISNMAVISTLTLNIYSASYFLAWKKENSECHIFEGAKGMVQSLVVGLPFTCLPLGMCIAGLAKVAKDEPRYMECVSALVMFEVVYIVCLGAVMTLCMSDASGKAVTIVTSLVVVVLLVLWGCCCRYPKCWRRFTLCKCLCGDVDLEEID